MQSRCYGEVLHLPLVCRGLIASSTLYGVQYIPTAWASFCLFNTEVFLGPNSQTGRREFTLFLLYFADSILF